MQEPPRNVCVNHTLCSYIYPRSGKWCLTLAGESSVYCEKHDTESREAKAVKKFLFAPGDGRCHGIKKKKNERCKAVGENSTGSRWYCPAHVDQDPNEGDHDFVEEEEEGEEKGFEYDQPRVIDFLEQQPYEALQWTQCDARIESVQCEMRSLEGNNRPWLCVLHRGTDSLPLEEINTLASFVDPGLPGAVLIVDYAQKKALDEDAMQDPQASGSNVDHMLPVEDADFEDIAGDVHPDEADLEEALEDEGLYNENAVRLREIIDADEADDEDSAGLSDDESCAGDFLSLEQVTKLTTSLDWKKSLEERWTASRGLLLQSAVLITQLRECAEGFLAEARRDRAEAGAANLKKALVVGATVVGAARRLEAIRAAEPWAVVVEEACEVMEPTLMSVLAVKSLRKLELVGDHRQLPAFIQNCWFSFESTAPSVKTSLFERLVTGKVATSAGHRRIAAIDAGPSPCTVLDEQRRMRSEIADLTRPDYADIVEIRDHAATAQQCVGDRIEKYKSAQKRELEEYKALAKQRELWIYKGREIPGVVPHIFFWDLKENREGRPVAGLSKCNYVEANAVASLTSYLLTCGVPQACISVITPYKGQKNAIIKALRDANVLPRYAGGPQKEASNTVVVSTVDRFQGDENDIIILSLVRTRPGNRFVGLLNRFIVAVSRPRLGLYIVGSTEAVTKSGDNRPGPEHWRRFITDLETSPDERRGVGQALTICCPRHHGSNRKIISLPDFPSKENWGKFCSAPCNYILPPCGHSCQELCHSPEGIPHTAKCGVEVPRPCSLHESVPLLCSDAMGSSLSLTAALKSYQCDVEVEFKRMECEHRERVKCHLQQQYINGQTPVPDCQAKERDFIHPGCGHVFGNMRCKKRRQYELQPPLCSKSVIYVRPCNCEVKLQCFEKAQEILSPTQCGYGLLYVLHIPSKYVLTLFIIRINKEINRPRCRHSVSMVCFKGQDMLQRWGAIQGVSASVEGTTTVVECGVNYGPPESYLQACIVPVKLILPCGHSASVPCDIAFKIANAVVPIPQCSHLVRVESPVCGHFIHLPCFLASFLESWNPPLTIEITELDTNAHCVTQRSLLEADWALMPKALSVALRQACHNSVAVIPICDEAHIFRVACSALLNIVFNKERPLKKCDYLYDRTLSCGHVRKVKCHTRAGKEPVCKAAVDTVLHYPCGEHEYRPGTCEQQRRFREGLLSGSVLCPVVVSAQRFRCNHPMDIRCAEWSRATAFVPGETINFLERDDFCVEIGRGYCEDRLLPPCRENVPFRNECGHIIRGVPCAEAFAFASMDLLPPPCTALLEKVSPLCGHIISPSCHVAAELRSWRPWGNGVFPELEKMSDLADEEIHVVRYDMQRPAEAPPAIPSENYCCGGAVLYIRKCGHGIRLPCLQGIYHDVGDCMEAVWDRLMS